MQALQSSSLLRPSQLTPAAKRPMKRPSFVAASSSRPVSAPKRETDPKKRVVITGAGLVSVFGNDVDAYYDRLLSGESGITTIDRFDASKFPTRFGGQIRGFSAEGYIDGKNDRRLDDCLRYCIVAGKKALEDADLGGDRLGKV
ncbi:3-ketoacyl-acyl carrier protein synthase I [Actinidia rufa]|uniref:beta-ketoacyl-[acyl-carrier-protein] synthase I n=1 Tax=Actinidia rufa TaxID=165716 RepID=A0A7J0DL59_9ERIC|nr:3-ketoacyl-acyl carrier protein synthase I [Actinidia rufa]